MINYSIVKRSNPLDDSKPDKWYGQAQTKDVLGLDQFAEHITSHGCVYSQADIQAVLLMAVACIKEQLLAGNIVKLGDFGTFGVSLSNRGSLTAADFSADNIVAVNARWKPGKALKNLRKQAEFKCVPQKKQSEAVLQGSKAGKSSVTI